MRWTSMLAAPGVESFPPTAQQASGLRGVLSRTPGEVRGARITHTPATATPPIAQLDCSFPNCQPCGPDPFCLARPDFVLSCQGIHTASGIVPTYNPTSPSRFLLQPNPRQLCQGERSNSRRRAIATSRPATMSAPKLSTRKRTFVRQESVMRCCVPANKRPRRLIADPGNSTLYTNRAMARLKMNLWDSVISDCNECLKFTPDSMKAHYYLSQAHLALEAYEEALKHALKAYDLCVKNRDKSLTAITSQVLKCKKERWADRDKRRRRETSDLEAEVVAMMERERDEVLSGDGLLDSERQEIREEWERKMEIMRGVFEKSRAAHEQRRKVPDWAIDDISFGFMHDPVIVSLICA
jgi:STIP1 homology and U-box containing protein 1